VSNSFEWQFGSNPRRSIKFAPRRNRYGITRRSVVVVVDIAGGGIGVMVRSVLVVVVWVTGAGPPHAASNAVAPSNAAPTT